jgi:hypothetical protein
MYIISNDDITYAKKLAIKKHSQYKYIDVDEFIQAAYLAICEAAHTFDPDKKTTFTTYCYKGIQQQLTNVLKFYPNIYCELHEIEDTRTNEDNFNYDNLTKDECTLIDSIKEAVYQSASMRKNIKSPILHYIKKFPK